MNILLRWLINTVAILLVATIVPGIHVSSFFVALIVAAVLGIINASIKPILLILTFPITLVTLGLFVFVINGLMLWLAAWLVPGFDIVGFWPAFWGALVISLIHFAEHQLESQHHA